MINRTVISRRTLTDVDEPGLRTFCQNLGFAYPSISQMLSMLGSAGGVKIYVRSGNCGVVTISYKPTDETAGLMQNHAYLAAMEVARDGLLDALGHRPPADDGTGYVLFFNFPQHHSIDSRSEGISAKSL